MLFGVAAVSVALRAVSLGEAFAAVSMGSPPPSPPAGVSMLGGVEVILAKAGWVRRSSSTKCLRREHIHEIVH